MTKYREEDNPHTDNCSHCVLTNTISANVNQDCPGHWCPSKYYEQGFLAAEKLYGWHKNCEETPVPNDCRVIIKGSDFMRIAHALTSDGNLFICGNVDVFRSEITHWREIPEIEE